MRGGRIVVREVSCCCDTGRGPEIGCIVQASELVPSPKAPPTDAELAAAGITPTPSPAAPARKQRASMFAP